MNCKHIQNIILTDYLDGQMDVTGMKVVDDHLAQCPQCQEFLVIAKKTTTDTFAGAAKVDLPQDMIWQKLKVQIEDEPGKNFASRIREMISNLKENILLRPMPAVAFGAMSVVILAVLFSNSYQSQLSKMDDAEETFETLSYVSNELSVASAEDSEDYGTEIEKYFL